MSATLSRVPPFAVEQWMEEHELSAKYNLAETCCASISIDELVALAESKTVSAHDLLDTSAVQNYGEIRGNAELRNNLSRLYSSKVGTPLSPDNILITNGAIAATHLAFYTLLGPGDHVICHYPTYQQLYTVPSTLGAEVSLWHSKPENNWLPDLDELKALVKPNTKLIIINNPQNPTGAILPRSLLTSLVEFTSTTSIRILSDEVYRPIFHSISPMSEDFPPSLLSLSSPNAIVTGSLSKAYSLAGIRVGWVACRDKAVIDAMANTRNYTTISVSQLDQSVAAFALSPNVVHALLARNLALAKENVAAVEKWVAKHDEYCTWTRPVAGTTAFVRFAREGRPVDAEEFCRRLLEKTGVMFLPGDKGFGQEWKGWVRIGFVNRKEVVKEGLEAARGFMRKEFEDVPFASEE